VFVKGGDETYKELTTNGTIASAAGYCALVLFTNVVSAMTTPRVYSAQLSTITNTIGQTIFAFSNTLPDIKSRHAIAPGCHVSTPPILKGDCMKFGLPVQITLVAIVSEKYAVSHDGAT
jgi:hypothetical protein